MAPSSENSLIRCTYSKELSSPVQRVYFFKTDVDGIYLSFSRYLVTQPSEQWLIRIIRVKPDIYVIGRFTLGTGDLKLENPVRFYLPISTTGIHQYKRYQLEGVSFIDFLGDTNPAQTSP
ncbi:MAG: hypothetical protein KC585_02605 [Candidatus Magasanikbacteria bacterium]|nr:hypothetical protein [Candidatus Magasanikbacteria bacterium]